MNKEQFNKLTIEQQIKEVNKLIEQFGSVNKVCKEIGIAKSTVRDRFKSNNYYYDLNNKKYKLKVEVIKDTTPMDEDNRNNKYYQQKKEQLKTNYSNNKVVIEEEKQMSNIVLNNKSLLALNFITENLERLESIIKMEDVIKRNEEYYNIVMPRFEGEITATTIKVNKKIWNEFSKFANTCNYSKKDIVSLAFKEFIDNHKQ